MPRGLDLMGSSAPVQNPVSDPVGLSFAVRALAVIEVHDSKEAQERKLSIRQICVAEEYLREHSATLSAALFRNFGRNCKPTFESFASTYYPESELASQVKYHADAIRRKLDLTR